MRGEFSCSHNSRFDHETAFAFSTHLDEPGARFFPHFARLCADFAQPVGGAGGGPERGHAAHFDAALLAGGLFAVLAVQGRRPEEAEGVAAQHAPVRAVAQRVFLHVLQPLHQFPIEKAKSSITTYARTPFGADLVIARSTIKK